MKMIGYDERSSLVRDIMECLEVTAYNPNVVAKQVYAKSLDCRSYQYKDEKLNELLGRIIGVSAGEEFVYSQDEIVGRLRRCWDEDGSSQGTSMQSENLGHAR